MARPDRTKPRRRVPHPAVSWLQRVAPQAATMTLLLGAMGLGLSMGLVRFAHRSPYCWVSAIEIRMAPGQRWVTDPRIGYRLSRPVHILKADLKGLARAIRREHPQLASVVVRRELPGRLVAQVSLREPLGQIRGRQYYLVSADAIVLAPGSSTAWEGLPVFLLGDRAVVYQPGQSCATPPLRQAIAVLQEVQRSKALKTHRVRAVRVPQGGPGSPDARMVTLVLDTGLELRAVPGDLGPQLTRLAELLGGRRREIAQAQYVDLRFDDLVIGMRGE